MKKSVLALSIAATIVGFSGGVQAMTAVGGATATALELNQDGIGQMLLVPYFTAQAENSTLINLVNTDTVHGKAVKVRFRGAANSDDIYDFQVFLSPGDVWTANVSKGADGRAQLTTNDASCTKPAKAVLNVTPFVTARLDSALDTAGKANGTREGYVEIFNMGDIPALVYADAAAYTANTAAGHASGTSTANPLYTAIKHVSKVAPCTGSAWTYLDTTDLVYGTADTAGTTAYAGLTAPTTGLTANWTIINTVGAAAWSGKAEAIQATDGAGTAAAGNVVYWPQTGAAVTAPNDFTADPLLRKGATSRVYGYDSATTTYTLDQAAAVVAGNYDLPDMSTPYFTGATVFTQAAGLTAAIAASSATNEFMTDSTILGTTDWVFSQPTRRYSVALDYAAISTTDDGRRFSNLFVDGVNFTTKAYFSGLNTVVTGRQICVKGPAVEVWDREESTLTASTDVVVSPSTPADPLSFCGEASVLSINNGGIQADGTKALKAAVAVKDLDVTYVDGWMKLTTPGATDYASGIVGLPVLGSSFMKATAGAQSYGVAYGHRFAR